MRYKQICIHIPAYFHVRPKFLTSYSQLRSSGKNTDIGWRVVGSNPGLTKPRRKTGGEDNNGGKSFLVCELVGPIDWIF